jgi:hypothetical protein
MTTASDHLSDARSGRVITASQVINGKRVQVQRRRPFAVFIGCGESRVLGNPNRKSGTKSSEFRG